MFHNRPQFVSTTSCRGTTVHSYTYGVSPQQVETWQLLQRTKPSRGLPEPKDRRWIRLPQTPLMGLTCRGAATSDES